MDWINYISFHIVQIQAYIVMDAVKNLVRISKYRRTGCTASFTDEVFVVADILETIQIPYQIAEIRNADKIINRFSEEELCSF